MKIAYICMAGLLAAPALAAEPAAPADDAVSLKAVKYADLARTVRDLQGKVVVVDFWGEFDCRAKRSFRIWSRCNASTPPTDSPPCRSASTIPKTNRRGSAS